MEKEISIKEQLLVEHLDVANYTRTTLKFLMQLLATTTGDEDKFFENIIKSDKAALIIQRVGSALSNLVKIEQDLLDQQSNIERRRNKNHNITRHDCELVISLVKGWGQNL